MARCPRRVVLRGGSRGDSCCSFPLLEVSFSASLANCPVVFSQAIGSLNRFNPKRLPKYSDMNLLTGFDAASRGCLWAEFSKKLELLPVFCEIMGTSGFSCE